jgi:hypothetical protein
MEREVDYFELLGSISMIVSLLPLMLVALYEENDFFRNQSIHISQERLDEAHQLSFEESASL